VSEEEAKANGDDPTIDFLTEEEDGEVLLVLTLSMNGIWKPEFFFPLLPVGLDKIDVLEAKLRDAQEEIQVLRERKITFLSLASNIPCQPNTIVDWNKTIGEFPASDFKLSEDYKQVTVMKAGVYQVQIRVAWNTSGTFCLDLELNENPVAKCKQSHTNNAHQNTPQIFEFMRLAINDVLQVRCSSSANGNSSLEAEANRLSILYLGA
jgi:hypothetical protein